jgi:hypothetical protein
VGRISTFMPRVCSVWSHPDRAKDGIGEERCAKGATWAVARGVLLALIRREHRVRTVHSR